jgi:hypothetical protein
MESATLEQATKILGLFKGTPREQIQALLESGFLTDLRDANFSQISRNDLRNVLGLKAILLREMGSITVPEQKSFAVGQKFFGPKNKMRIYYLDNRLTWIIEDPVPQTKIIFADLVTSMNDMQIKEELGKRKNIALSQVYALMEMQSEGKVKVFKEDGSANLFYYQDCPIRVCFDGSDWELKQYDFSLEHPWGAGVRVLYRAS